MQLTLETTITSRRESSALVVDQPQALDLLVDGRVFFNVSVRPWDVRLGLVVIEVRDEILDGVLGEELLELAVELRGECLVVRDNEGGPAEIADDVGSGERFARAGHAEEGLVAVAGLERFSQLGDGLALVLPAVDNPRQAGIP